MFLSAAACVHANPARSRHITCAGIFSEIFPFIHNDNDNDGDDDYGYYDDASAYRKLLDRTCFPGCEYDLSQSHEVQYPEDVAKKKGDLLRPFNPLVEEGDEHQLHFIEEGTEGGSTAASEA